MQFSWNAVAPLTPSGRIISSEHWRSHAVPVLCGFVQMPEVPNMSPVGIVMLIVGIDSSASRTV